MAAHGARTRARRIHKHGVEQRGSNQLLVIRGKTRVQVDGITRGRKDLPQPRALDALRIRLAFTLVQVERNMLVIKIAALRMGEHHERLGAATGANLEARPLTRHRGGNELRVIIGGDGICMRKGIRTHELTHAVDRIRTGKLKRSSAIGGKGIFYGFGAQRIDLHRDGSRLELALEHGLRALLPQRVDNPAHEPCGQASATGARHHHAMLLGNILGGEEGIRPFRYATQHRIGEAGGPMSAHARELHALAHRDLRRSPQVEQLIRTDTQRVAHVGCKRTRIVEHAVESVVQATAATRDTQCEATRKGGIARVERSGCAGVGGELAGIAPRLTGGDQNAQGNEAPRRQFGRLTQGNPMPRHPHAGRRPRTWRPSRACHPA